MSRKRPLENELDEIQGNASRMGEYIKLKKELQKRLTSFYRASVCKFPLSPFDFNKDERHSVILKPELSISHSRVTDYRDIFFKNGKELQNIYIVGQPGAGKSTFCNYLTSVWCDTVLDSHSGDTDCSESQGIGNRTVHFSVDKMLKHFDFVFLVALRMERGQGDIESIIENQIMKQICKTKEGFNVDVIRRVMEEEKCLVIIDGLDEWPHSIPERTYREKWTYISTTRPLKMVEIQLPDSMIDVLISIGTVRSYTYMFRKKLQRLGDVLNDTMLDIKLKQELLKAGKITARSRCKLFVAWLEQKIKMTTYNHSSISSPERSTEFELPNCFSMNQTKFCIEHKAFIESISRLAFGTLSPKYLSSSILFNENIVSRFVSKSQVEMALKTRILVLNKPTTHSIDKFYVFNHRVFQEFFCAVYIASEKGVDVNDSFERLLRNHGLDVCQTIFRFLCGMVPSGFAESLSKLISDHQAASIDRLCSTKRDGCAVLLNSVHFYEQVVMSVFNECVDNGHPKPSLVYQHANICVDPSNCNDVEFKSRQKFLLDLNAGHMKTLIAWPSEPVDEFQNEVNRNSTLTSVVLWDIGTSEDPTAKVDLTACDQLKHLMCSGISNVSRIAISPKSLNSCRLLSLNSSLEREMLTALEGDAPMLQTLSIDPCHFPDQLISLLRKLNNLQYIRLGRVDADSTECHLQSSDNVTSVHVENLDWPVKTWKYFIDILTNMPKTMMCKFSWKEEDNLLWHGMTGYLAESSRYEDVVATKSEARSGVVQYNMSLTVHPLPSSCAPVLAGKDGHF